ncbi:MAG: electron transport complex protein RnfA [Gammaproteobacteria bacterium]|nr:electron transport complex subunit RsxA [Chromatiales bacterium]MDB4498086.1 electron transport complex subunit RsxA [Gammaproteobacteria bacterium]
MTEFILIIIGTVLVNNLVLTRFLGLCPFVGATTSIESAFGMSAATTFVLTLASALAWMVNTWLLQPFGLEYLRLICFILVIAATVQFTEIFIRSTQPMLHQMLGIFLPLITTNCAVLGVALLITQEQQSFIEAIIYGLGGGLGFALVIILFAALRERLQAADVPLPFRGSAIALITAGFMALAFMGFAGLAGS